MLLVLVLTGTKIIRLLYWLALAMCSIIINNLIGNYVILTEGFSKVPESSIKSANRSAITKEDEKLLAVLQHNARASISDLARQLSVSRSTVQTRLQKLELSGVIKGYTVEYGDEYLATLVAAHVSIKVRQKLTARTNIELKQLPQVAALYAISGEYDLIAIVQAQNTEQLSHILDDIGNLEGVERTTSSVILETKFKR